MWRNSLPLLACLLLLAVLAGPASASSLLGIVGVSDLGPCSIDAPVAPGLGGPFGFLDGDGVTGGNGATGFMPLIGWALADDGVLAVDILVDGNTVGRATLGLRRSDVSAIFPGFPDSPLPGFAYQLDTTRWPNGLHQVSAVVVSKTAQAQQLTSGQAAHLNTGQAQQLNTLVIQFSNNTHDLKPFGQITSPLHNAQVFGNCDLADPARYTVIAGWALDLGVEDNDHGVGYVELLIDGAIHRNTRLHCHHSITTGAYTDCYGKRNESIERQYPFARDSPNAGFRFVIDVGQLVRNGYAEGHHVFTVRVGDIDSQVSNIDTANVNFVCQDLLPDEGSFGAIDNVPDRHSGGIIDITGWVLDADGINRVRLFVDGTDVGLATYGFPRPSVTSMHPGFPNSAAPAFLLSLDTTGFSIGEHAVSALAIDNNGVETSLGEVHFLVFN